MVDSILPLNVTDAVVRRRGKTLLGPISLQISQAGFTMIIGPNGSGKTTLLRAMHGLERLSGGAISWSQDQDAARQRQAFVFQTPIMLRRSVRDNLIYPLTTHGTAKTQAISEANDWAKRIHLGDALDRPATFLSGGEKQKLALGRALIRKPDILFLDEPCANLDGRATREIEAILKHAHETGTRIVMSTHDMGQARRLATEVFFIFKGKVHEHESAPLFFEDPKTRETKAFLSGDIVE
mgnify:FL=1